MGGRGDRIQVLPDGTYAVWRGNVYPACATAKRGIELLRMPDADNLPADYRPRRPGSPWVEVPASELTRSFSRRTFAIIDGRVYRVDHVRPDGKLQISAFGIGEDRARTEGWTPTLERGEYVRSVERSELDDLYQREYEIG